MPIPATLTFEIIANFGNVIHRVGLERLGAMASGEALRPQRLNLA